jgi:hypothetical protein
MKIENTKNLTRISMTVGALVMTNMIAACGGGGGGAPARVVTTPASGGTISTGAPVVNPAPRPVNPGPISGPISPVGPVGPIRPIAGPIQNPVLPIQNPIRPLGGQPVSATQSSTGIAQDTTDVNLQRGLAADADLDSRAQVTATQFQMNFDSARQLTALADKMAILQQEGQLSSDDRAALARSALAVAGLQENDVTDAIARAANGDQNAIEDVMMTGATTLGMPSTTMLRDQILPSLGVLVP